MNVLEEKNRRDIALSEVLNKLADAKTNITNDKVKKKEYYLKLKEIYGVIQSEKLENKEYRHKYSLILSHLIEFDSNPDKDIRILLDNVQAIYEFSANKQDPVKFSIEKLYDHINLDFARLDYIKYANNINLIQNKQALFELEEQKDKVDKLKEKCDFEFASHMEKLEKTKDEFEDEIKSQEEKNKSSNVTILYTMIGTVLSFSVLAGSFEAVMNMPLVTQRVALVMANIAIVFITLYFIKVLNFDNTNEKIKKHLKYVIGVFLVLLLIVIGSMVVEYNVYGSKVEEYENTVEELNTKIQKLEERINDLNLVSINNTYEGDKGSLD